MITCAFLGHRELYDLNMEQNIRSAINRVMATRQDVEFLFHVQGGHGIHTYGDFYNHCLSMALEAKHRYPHKVKLTVLLPSPNMDNRQNFLGFLFDNIIFIDSPDMKDEFRQVWKKAVRKYILNAQYVITYYYASLRDENVSLFKATKKCHGINIIDLTDTETSAYIQSCIEHLDENEKDILRKIDRGAPYTSIARESGVSRSTIWKNENQCRQELRLCAQQRFYRKSITEGPSSFKACTLMLSGPIHNLNLFRAAINFLVDSLGVSEFRVAQLRCFNPYAVELKRIIGRESKAQMVAYTHFPVPPRTSKGSFQNLYQPMYSKVVNTNAGSTLQGRITQAELKMLNFSEYAICDIGKDPELHKRIQKQLNKFKQLKVFDLGNRPCSQVDETDHRL